MEKRVKPFGEWKKRLKKRWRPERSDGSVEQVHQGANQAVRDWQSDAYRGQSGRREADVTPIY